MIAEVERAARAAQAAPPDGPWVGVKWRHTDAGWRCEQCGTEHGGWVTCGGRVLVVPAGVAHPMGYMGEQVEVPVGVATTPWPPTRDAVCSWRELNGGVA